MQLMLRTMDELNIRLRNALDVDLKITSLQNVQSHQKITRNGKSKYVLIIKINRACNNGEKNSDQKIYASMALMSGNDECPSGNFGNSLQLTNCVLDSGAMCHMRVDLSVFG